MATESKQCVRLLFSLPARERDHQCENTVTEIAVGDRFERSHQLLAVFGGQETGKTRHLWVSFAFRPARSWRAFIEKSNGCAERGGDLAQSARADTVDPPFVFLHLLKRQIERTSERLLRHAL